MNCIDRNHIRPGHPAYAYQDDIAHKAKLLYNASLFRVRNHFTARRKTSLTDNEQFVEDELSLLPTKPGAVISAFSLQKLMTLTHNPDYYAGIPSQIAQHVVAQAVTDFKNWLSALKAWKKSPAGFTGKPRMPRYKKKDVAGFTIPNQSAVIKDGQLTFPKTDVTVACRVRSGSLREVKVTPCYDGYLLCLCWDVPDEPQTSYGSHSAAVDFGVNNVMAAVTDEGDSVLFHGGAVKAENRYYNKEKARLISIITRGHQTTARVSSHRIEALSFHRQEFLHDTFQKMSSRLMEWCLANDVGTLVLGSNKGWKQKASLGHVNNQTFVSIPLDSLKRMLRYKAGRLGITVIEQEESYTSKASFPDRDDIPVYGANDSTPAFSGYRIQRGLYKSKDGTVINADLNAAANILRKAGFETANVSVDRLKCPLVIGYKALNTRIPAEGIAAV